MSSVEPARRPVVALPTTPISPEARGIPSCGSGLSKLNAASLIVQGATAHPRMPPSGQTCVLAPREEMQTGAPARRSFTLQAPPSSERLRGCLLLLEASVDMREKPPVSRRKNGRRKKRLRTRARPPISVSVKPPAQRPTKLNAASLIIQEAPATLPPREEMQTAEVARRYFALQAQPSSERLKGCLLLLDAAEDMRKNPPVSRRKNGRRKKRLRTRARPPISVSVKPPEQRPTKRIRAESAEGSVDHEDGARASLPPRLTFRVRIRGTGRTDLSPQAYYFYRKLPTLVHSASLGLSNDCFKALVFDLRLFYIIAKQESTNHLFSLNDLENGLKHRYGESNLKDPTINLIIQFASRSHIETTKTIGHFKYENFVGRRNLSSVIKSALTIHNPDNIHPIAHRRISFRRFLTEEWTKGAKVHGALDRTLQLILSDLKGLQRYRYSLRGRCCVNSYG